jgi:hypothetical protein
MELLGAEAGKLILAYLLFCIGIIILVCIIFYLIVKNAVKNGVFEAKIKYHDYIEECKARTKQDINNHDFE